MLCLFSFCAEVRSREGEKEKKQRRSPKVTRSSVFYDLIWENCCQKKTAEKQTATHGRLEGVGRRSEGETVSREQHNRTFKRQILSLSSPPSLLPAIVEPLLLPHSTSPMGQQVWTVAYASCLCQLLLPRNSQLC